MVAAAAAAEELDRQIKTDDKTASGKVYDEAADGQHTRTEDDEEEEEGVRMSMLQHTNWHLSPLFALLDVANWDGKRVVKEMK